MKVYFIQEGNGHVKIGKAVNVEERLKAMQTGNSQKLQIRLVLNYESHKKALEMEKYFHRKFKRFRVRGEWFNKKVLSKIRDQSYEKMTEEMKEEISKEIDMKLAVGFYKKGI